MNNRELDPHLELGLFSLPNLRLLDLSQPKPNSDSKSKSSSLPSGPTIMLPELLSCLPISLVELKLERRLIQGAIPSVQVHLTI